MEITFGKQHLLNLDTKTVIEFFITVSQHFELNNKTNLRFAIESAERRFCLQNERMERNTVVFVDIYTGDVFRWETYNEINWGCSNISLQKIAVRVPERV